MKKLFLLLLLGIGFLSCYAQSTSNVPPRYYVDSNAKYQLYPTENRWNFIKLDTQTGKMWMVQYTINDPDNRATFRLNDESLVLDEDKSPVGRFTLYPTQNHYTFILLDQTDGRTWQVQWSTKPDEKGIWRIW